MAAPPRHMTRPRLLNAALLAAVAVLAAFIYFKPRHDEPGTFPLSTLRADEITTLRIERVSRPQIVLEKNGGQWLISAPISARADPYQMQRLLAILDARAVSRLAATELSRFDLDRPLARLTANTQTFSFGMVNTVAREQYVLTGDAVYPVELRYGAALPADVTQLISKQLLAADEVPVSFDFGAFSVKRNAGKWIATSADRANAAAMLSQDDILRWVDNWRFASALRVAPHSAGPAHNKVNIRLENGTELALVVIQRDPQLVLLRPDLGLQYSFVADAASRLLSPPSDEAARR